MTSALTPLKRYFVYQHQALQGRNQEMFDDFDQWVKVDEGKKVPVTNVENDRKRNFKDYCEYFAEQMAAPVGRVLSSDCKLFLENVWNQGNMIPVPNFFNKARASDKYGDTVDRMLTYLYYYISSGDDKYLNLFFCVDEKEKKGEKQDLEKAKTAMEKTKAWIDAVCGKKKDEETWNAFVEMHFLQPFCKLDENGIYIPVCMYNNKPLQYVRPPYPETQLKFLPDNLEECECFFRTLNTAIRERSRLIQQKINSKQDLF